MSTIPDIDYEAVYKSVINKMNTERVEHITQVTSLEQLSNTLLEQRNKAETRVKELETELDNLKSSPLEPDEIVE